MKGQWDRGRQRVARLKAGPLENYIKHSLKIGIIVGLIALMILAYGVHIGGFRGTVLTAVGGALIPAALLNAILDPLLKNEATADILKVLDVRDSVRIAGLQHLGPASGVDLRDYLGGCTQITIVPLDPKGWADRHFARVLEHCSRVATHVSIYIPAPGHDDLASLGGRLHRNVSELESEMRQLPDQLGDAWSSSAALEGASLEVFHYEGVAAAGLVRTTEFVLLELAPVVRFAAVGRETYFLIGKAGGTLADWVPLDVTSQSFPPTLACVRPLAGEVGA